MFKTAINVNESIITVAIYLHTHVSAKFLVTVGSIILSASTALLHIRVLIAALAPVAFL